FPKKKFVLYPEIFSTPGGPIRVSRHNQPRKGAQSAIVPRFERYRKTSSSFSDVLDNGARLRLSAHGCWLPRVENISLKLKYPVMITDRRKTRVIYENV